MSDKTHCDLCDAVIEPGVERLILTVGIAIGNNSNEEELPRDFCQACISQHTALQRLWSDFSEPLEPAPVQQLARIRQLVQAWRDDDDAEHIEALIAVCKVLGVKDSRDPIAAAVDAQLDPLKDQLTAIGRKLAEQAQVPTGHSNTCDLVGFRQGDNAPGVCSCGAEGKPR